MKKISRPILLSLAGLMLAVAPALRADAQPAPATPPANQPAGPRGHHGDMRERFQHMSQELNLTPDQKTKGEAIFQQSADAIKSIRGDTTLSEDEKRAKIKELRRGTEQQVHALLTPDQLAKMKELRQQHRSPQGNPPPAAPTPPAT